MDLQVGCSSGVGGTAAAVDGPSGQHSRQNGRARVNPLQSPTKCSPSKARVSICNFFYEKVVGTLTISWAHFLVLNL